MQDQVKEPAQVLERVKVPVPEWVTVSELVQGLVQVPEWVQAQVLA
jgi:hypothetical protein